MGTDVRSKRPSEIKQNRYGNSRGGGEIHNHPVGILSTLFAIDGTIYARKELFWKTLKKLKAG